MKIVCLDLEGVLVPEIWIEFSKRTGIPELMRTTRDEPDYDKLMNYRLDILRQHKLGLPDIQKVIGEMGPMEGARAFLDAAARGLPGRHPVRHLLRIRPPADAPARLADAVLPLAGRRRPAACWSTTTCACRDQKREAVKRFKELNFKVVAAGDSYNDTAMLGEAHGGILFHPPENVIREFPQYPGRLQLRRSAHANRPRFRQG